jgi:hypothetical protein
MGPGSRGISASGSGSSATAPKRIGVRAAALRRSGAAAGLVLALSLGAVSPSQADEYDPKRAGHPLRIVAYVVHPIGVAVDYLFLRPMHWLGSQQPLATIFGHEED